MSHAATGSQPRFKERIESLCADMIDRGIQLSEALEQFERCFIHEVVQRSDGQHSRAAAALGIHRNTLTRRIASYKARRK
jgi:transcriptional regulator with PAS, ATPase and Fis domain